MRSILYTASMTLAEDLFALLNFDFRLYQLK